MWASVFGQIADKAAHEIKDALNGVVLNVEVLRSRTDRAAGESQGGSDLRGLRPFAGAAALQLETLGARVESLLFLARPHSERAGVPDVGTTLKHLGTLLVAAAKADGAPLEVSLDAASTATSASAAAVRLALAAAMLAVMRQGAGGRVQLSSEKGATLVRFSHESAGACTLDPEVSAAIEGSRISIRRSETDLVMVFPGTKSHGT